MNNVVKNALLQIKFVEKYEGLAQKYNDKRILDEDRLIYVDGEEVLSIIEKYGYSASFNKKEKFYKTEDIKLGDYSFRTQVILYYGMVDLVWVVKKGEELLLGEPWGEYARELIDIDYYIKSPVISDYDELENILSFSFDLFKEFQKVIVNHD